MSLVNKYLPYYTIEERDRWEGDWELIEGIPYALASPSVNHQRIVANLVYALKGEISKCNTNCEVLPDIDYYISEDTVVRPDVVVVCEKIHEKLVITPNIIFEIVSPSSIKVDQYIKYELYEREGVDYYVLIYPEERKHVKIYKIADNKYKKEFETVDGIFEFQLKDCIVSLDFSKILS